MTSFRDQTEQDTIVSFDDGSEEEFASYDLRLMKKGSVVKAPPAPEIKPTSFNPSNEKWYLDPSGKWLEVGEHEDAAYELLDKEGRAQTQAEMDDGVVNPAQEILEGERGYLRVVVEGDRLTFSTMAGRSPSSVQMSELKDTAIENNMELVGYYGQRERVIWSPDKVDAALSDNEYDKRADELYDAVQKAVLDMEIDDEDAGSIRHGEVYDYEDIYQFGHFVLDLGIPLTEEDMTIFEDSGMIEDKLPRNITLSTNTEIKKPYYKIADDGHSIFGYWEDDKPIRIRYFRRF